MKKGFIGKANIALLGLVGVLAVTWGVAKAQHLPPGWTGPSPGNPPGCEPIIDLTASCSPMTIGIAWSNRYTTCKTSGSWCCDYSTWSKTCYSFNGTTYAPIPSGSIAQYDASYLDLTCPGVPNAPSGCL